MTFTVPSGGDADSFVRDAMWAVANEFGVKHPNELSDEVRNALILVGKQMAYPRILSQFKMSRLHFGMAKKQIKTVSQYAQEILRMQEELQALRQALWDIAGIAGADLDGSPTPDVVVPPLPEYVKEVVKDLRESYDGLLKEGTDAQ